METVQLVAREKIEDKRLDDNKVYSGSRSIKNVSN
jgi:hypothetical protein